MTNSSNLTSGYKG